MHGDVVSRARGTKCDSQISETHRFGIPWSAENQDERPLHVGVVQEVRRAGPEASGGAGRPEACLTNYDVRVITNDDSNRDGFIAFSIPACYRNCS
jgi:hypothetical protein